MKVALAESSVLRRAAGVSLLALGLIAFGLRVHTLTAGPNVWTDFAHDYVSARAWMAGGDPYQPLDPLVRRDLGYGLDGFLEAPRARISHTPSYLIVTMPVARLPYRIAVVTWMSLMTASMFWALYLLGGALGWSRRSRVIAGIASVGIPSAHEDLLWGGGTMLLVLLFVLAWISLERGRDRTAGVLLGVAVSLKLFPLFAIVPLVRGRRWRAATAMIISGCAALGASFVALGRARSLTFLTKASPGNFSFWGAASNNISLIRYPFSWFKRGPSSTHAIDAPAVAMLLALAIITTLAVLTYRSPAGRGADGVLTVAPTMLLAAPLCWSFYVPLAYPAAIFLWRDRRRLQSIGYAPVIAVVTIVLLAFAPPSWPSTVMLAALAGLGALVSGRHGRERAYA